MRREMRSIACMSLFLLACGSTTAPLDSGAAVDASGFDAAALDGATGADLDASRPDASRPDASMSESDAGPSCADPPGSACNPIVIDRFPFTHSADTSAATEDALDGYACAPSIDESGPEIHYELRLAAAQRVSLELTESSGVDVDVHVLRAPVAESCMARANTTLDTALGAGSWRVIVDTFSSSGTDRSGGYVLDVDITEPAARSLGTMWNTFYFLADEDDHTGAHDTPIYDSDCNEITRVRAEFHDSVCIEGSGILSDDRVINYASSCTSSCPSARRCGSASYRICYSVLDSTRYPWGQGAGSRALEPDRSIAVDRDVITLGTWVYFEELDGLIRPGTAEPHDGCMRADDVGGAITGDHFDFFSGTRSRWLEWESLLPTRSTLTAWADDPRCYPRP